MDNITFEDLEASGYNQNDKAFFELDLNNDSDVLAWMMTELGRLKNESWQKLEIVKNNYLRFKGIQYQAQVYTPRDVLETQKSYNPQIVVPFVRDAVEEKVSRLMEYKPSVFPMPTHDETKDKNDATVAKKFMQHIDYTKDTEKLFRKFVRNSRIGGESYLWITWNPDLGEPLKAYDVLGRETGEEIPADIMAMLKDKQRQGDVQIKNKTQFFVWRPNCEWVDTDYIFVEEWVDVAKLKKEYPEKAGDIQAESKEPLFDFNTMVEKQNNRQCKKKYFYHRHTKFLPEGYEACFVSGAILKKGKLSYDHGELPVVLLQDQENPDEHVGTSFIENIRALSSAMNNMINMTVKNLMLAGNAKWFVQNGSIDEQQLNNDIGIVRVKSGAADPKLLQANPVSNQLGEWLQVFKDMFYQMAKSNSISRGDLPEGVTANVALQFISESENKRSVSEVKQVHEAIRKAYDLILKTCGQYYKPTDQRTMQIMGKDGQFALENYDVSAIAKPYNLILQSASGLPESKALRTQFIIDMSNARPGMLPDEQVVEMLGFGQTEKFMDISTAAARAAEDENELMMAGQMIEPAQHEDHITHWRIHTMAIQQVGFKLKTDPIVQQIYQQHIMATEMLMGEQAKFSPQYLGLLAQLPQWPMYYKDPLVSQMLGMATGALQTAQQASQPLPGGSPKEQSKTVDNSTAM